MPYGILGGIAAVAAGAGRGGSIAWMDKLKEDSRKTREDNLLRLRDQYAQKGEERAEVREEKRFKRGILQEETTYQRRELDKDRRFEEQLDKTIALNEQLVDIKDEALTEMQKQVRDLAGLMEDDPDGKTAKEKAQALVLQSFTQKKGEGLKRAELYSKLRNDAIESFTGGLGSPTEDQLSQADRFASSLTGIVLKGAGAPLASEATTAFDRIADLFGRSQTEATETTTKAKRGILGSAETVAPRAEWEPDPEDVDAAGNWGGRMRKKGSRPFSDIRP